MAEITVGQNDCTSEDVVSIVGSIGHAVYQWAMDTDDLKWSSNFCELIGFVDGVNISKGRQFEKLLSSDSQQTRFGTIHSETVVEPSNRGVSYQCVYAIQPELLKGGQTVWLEDTGRWYPDADGKPVRAQGVVRIINERRKREETLKRKSEYDDLTGLANRRFLEEHIEQSAAQGLLEHKVNAFLLVSLCEFERINNIYGFVCGDEVLQQVADLLRTEMRGKDFVARFSGAKFGLVLNGCDSTGVMVAAKRIQDALQERIIKTNRGPVSIRSAIGVCLLPRHASKSIDAISCATEALNQARREKGLGVCVFDPDPKAGDDRRRKARVVSRFVECLERGEMHLVFQPVVNAENRKIVFHEALLRLNSGEPGLIEDASFIKIAEDLGLMRLVDMHSMKLVLDVLEANPDAKLSLNITHESLESADWFSLLASRLKEIENGAERLIIEVTESQLPVDIDETNQTIGLLKAMGCKVAIDDFGAGYTSFSHLKDLNADIVKVDGAFCRSLKEEPRNSVFLKSILDLSKAFGVETIVEWVEDEATAVQMHEMGHTMLQGSLIGMPSLVEDWGQHHVHRMEKLATQV